MNAYETARAAGIIDTFLSFPAVREAKAREYDYIRAATRDAETQTMEMPAGYMFKDLPTYDGIEDPVDFVLAQMDRHGIERFLVTVGKNADADRAVREHPNRFWASLDVDPNQGMGALRSIDAALEQWGESFKAVHVWGTALVPSVAINDKAAYPVYAKCVEVGRPVILYAGVPGPRIPMAPQLPILLDEICWFFPELRVIIRHGGEPWTDLVVKLLLKWPNLYYSTSAFAPRYYPKDIVDFANTRGGDKIMFAGYWAAGLTLERTFAELPNVPFGPDVWAKFLRGNAERVLGGAPYSS